MIPKKNGYDRKPNFSGLSNFSGLPNGPNGPTCANPMNQQSPDYFYDFGSLIVWPKFKFNIKIINFDLYYLRISKIKWGQKRVPDEKYIYVYYSIIKQKDFEGVSSRALICVDFQL